jgi:TolA-binding protein
MSKAERERETVVEALGALLRSEAATARGASDEASRARLLRRAAEQSSGPRHARQWWPVLAVPVLAAAGAVLVWGWTPRVLRYDVIGTTKDGDYVSAPEDHAVTVNFSDDTRVEVAANSQLRVEDATRRGARVLLERGEVSARVVHREHTQWTFAAGPFEVLVTGTRFDLRWDPTAEVLTVRLLEGSVQVQTPFDTAPVPLRAGEDFRADLRARNMTTTDQAAPSNIAPVPEAPPPDVKEPAPSATSSAADVPAAPPSASRAWPKLIALGRFADVLAQADKGGAANCMRTCSASDLSALADAARYTGHADLAEQSLRALRARFSQEPEGRSSAFLLGRLREQQGNATDARSWYQRYVSETPRGSYAAEALAGTMRTTVTLDGQKAAVPIAEDYLHRYPTGVHAATARAILSSP